MCFKLQYWHIFCWKKLDNQLLMPYPSTGFKMFCASSNLKKPSVKLRKILCFGMVLTEPR